MTAFVEPDRDKNHRTIKSHECASRTCMYLGDTVLYEGDVMGGGID